jgi:hypothetical protein
VQAQRQPVPEVALGATPPAEVATKGVRDALRWTRGPCAARRAGLRLELQLRNGRSNSYCTVLGLGASLWRALGSARSTGAFPAAGEYAHPSPAALAAQAGSRAPRCWAHTARMRGEAACPQQPWQQLRRGQLASLWVWCSGASARATCRPHRSSSSAWYAAGARHAPPAPSRPSWPCHTLHAPICCMLRPAPRLMRLVVQPAGVEGVWAALRRRWPQRCCWWAGGLRWLLQRPRCGALQLQLLGAHVCCACPGACRHCCSSWRPARAQHVVPCSRVSPAALPAPTPVPQPWLHGCSNCSAVATTHSAGEPTRHTVQPLARL